LSKKKNLVKEAEKRSPDIIRLWESGGEVKDIAKALVVCEHAVMYIITKFEIERESKTLGEKSKRIKRLLKEIRGFSEEDN